MVDSQIIFRGNKVKIILGASSDLTEMSFALETAISHFLGRGIYIYSVTRSKSENNCIVELQANCTIGLMQMSNVASIGSAVNAGLIPNKCLQDFREEQDKVLDGQNQYQKTTGKNISVIEGKNLDKNVQLSTISYGLADMLTGLFYLGVNYAKWQYSIQSTQLLFRHDLTDNQIQQFLKSKQDYPLREIVSKLK